MTSIVPTPLLLDPAVLATVGDLSLVARAVVEGMMGGEHRSPRFGSSMDFAEHRAYMPGDDIRRIDWKLFARTDRHYVKEFEADTNTNVAILLDVSRSMHYPPPGAAGARPSKAAYGALLAACLAYLADQQRDRVGLVTFDADVVDYVPPAAKHVPQVLWALDRVARDGGRAARAPATLPLSAPPVARPPSPAPRLSTVTRRLADLFRRRSVVVVISDLYEEPEAVVEAIGVLRGRGNDIAVFHLLDPTELEFPFDGAARFQDLETGERMPVVPEYLRAEYRALVAAHVAALTRLLGGHGVDYALFDTARPLDRALHGYLSLRERRPRARAR